MKLSVNLMGKGAFMWVGAGFPVTYSKALEMGGAIALDKPPTGTIDTAGGFDMDRLTGDIEADTKRLVSMLEATNSQPMSYPEFMDRIRACRRLAKAIERALT